MWLGLIQDRARAHGVGTGWGPPGGQRPFLGESGFLGRLMRGRCSLVGKGQQSRSEGAEVRDTPRVGEPPWARVIFSEIKTLPCGKEMAGRPGSVSHGEAGSPGASFWPALHPSCPLHPLHRGCPGMPHPGSPSGCRAPHLALFTSGF